MSDSKKNKRFSLLCRFMEEHNLDGLMIAGDADRRMSGNSAFATGFTYFSGLTILPKGMGPDEATIIIGMEQYKYVNSVQLFSPWIRYVKAGYHHIQRVLGEFGIESGRLGIVGQARCPAGLYSAIKKFAPKVKLVDVTAGYEALRRIKDENSIQALREAGKTIKTAFKSFQAAAIPGQSEQMVLAEVFKSARDAGADSHSLMMFSNPEIRLATGSGGGVLRDPSPEKVINDGDIVLGEITLCREGFWVVIGRTALSATASSEQKSFLSACEKVLGSGVSKMRPGAKACEIYNAMTDAAESEGIKDSIVYKFGWGIGMDVCESPAIAAEDETVIEKGMAFAIRVGGASKEASAIVSDTLVVGASGVETITA